MLSAVIVLAIMILPTVINVSISAIKAVPDNLRSASLALGASKIQTVFKVVIPAAKSGIMTGIGLGIGRALASIQFCAFSYNPDCQRNELCKRVT